MRPQYRIYLSLLCALFIAASGWAADFDCHNVEVCPPQYDPCGCENVAPLTLEGPGEPQVGDFYTASGGAPPYTFSFDGGEINEKTGEIISITECGGSEEDNAMGIVSVTDRCSDINKDVRLPGGMWVYIESPNINNCGALRSLVNYRKVEGDTKYEGQLCGQWANESIWDSENCHWEPSPCSDKVSFPGYPCQYSPNISLKAYLGPDNFSTTSEERYYCFIYAGSYSVSKWQCSNN